MSNPNDPYPQPPAQPPYGGPPPHQPYGGPPQPPYGAPRSGNSKLLIGIIAALVLIIAVGATLYFAGVFGGERRKDYSLSEPGQAPALSRDFLIGGTWREACETFRHLEFDHTGTFAMTTDDGRGYGNWSISPGGASVTVEGRPAQLSIQPLGPDTMRVTADGDTKTLIRC